MKLIKQNSLFLVAYLLVVICVGYLVITYTKIDLHREINALVGNRYINTFFKYITYLGDGLFSIIVGVVFLTINVRKGILIIGSYIVSSLFTTFLKFFFFDDVNRPFFVFNYEVREQLNLVEGVHVYIHNTFPSGHSTSVFALCTTFALLSKTHVLKLLFLFSAVVVAFSRTYLSQHWLVDIYVGSIIGVLFATLWYWLVINNSIFQKLDKPLIELIKK